MEVVAPPPPVKLSGSMPVGSFSRVLVSDPPPTLNTKVIMSQFMVSWPGFHQSHFGVEVDFWGRFFEGG